MTVYILVVDDEPDIEALFRQRFRDDLRSQRFQMEFATAALRPAAETREASLILILFGHQHASGLELLPVMRTAHPDVPVIMITAYSDTETRRKAIERGAQGLLTKPIDFALLREAIDARLEHAT